MLLGHLSPGVSGVGRRRTAVARLAQEPDQKLQPPSIVLDNEDRSPSPEWSHHSLGYRQGACAALRCSMPLHEPRPACVARRTAGRGTQRSVEQLVHLGVDRHPAVRRQHLGVHRRFVEACRPVDDPVPLRLDRQRTARPATAELRVAHEVVAARAAAAITACEPARPAPQGRRSRHPGSTPAVDRVRVHVRRAQRHDGAHQLRPPDRQHAREQAAAALPDQDRRLTLPAHEVLQAALEAARRGGGAIHVQPNAQECAVTAARNQEPSIAICASPVRKPGISITGRVSGRVRRVSEHGCRISDASSMPTGLPPDRRERHRSDPHDISLIDWSSVSSGLLEPRASGALLCIQIAEHLDDQRGRLRDLL